MTSTDYFNCRVCKKRDIHRKGLGQHYKAIHPDVYAKLRLKWPEPKPLADMPTAFWNQVLDVESKVVREILEGDYQLIETEDRVFRMVKNLSLREKLDLFHRIILRDIDTASEEIKKFIMFR